MRRSQYVLESVRKDEEFVLYRGEWSNQAGSPFVLLLAPSSTRPALETLKKLEREYSLRDELDSTFAVRPLALTQQQGRMTLVLEDPGGETLDGILSGPLEISRFLSLAIGIAAALSKVHKRELIHKDVKPGNVLVDPATGQVRLMGFGMATRLPRERQAPAPPEFIAGTLPYMAPEQTGRMNRSVDSRSDLYALGATLYEMLTGTLPFSATDPMELVHSHIARQPVPPGDRLPGIPQPVSAIIMKLLAKTGEERYQTAAGAARDLRRCLDEWATQHRIDDFSLGEQDTPDRLLIPEKLYGRESEIGALLAAFDRVVAGGRPELVLVSGYSGIGKSSVVNELHKPLVPPRGLFASGKFDQYKRDVPYATLAQAFQMLVRQILVKSEAEVDPWRHALLEALGPNGQLMVNLIPEVEFVIGKQPPVVELPPQEARGRFQLVFRRFLGVFARPEHPLALFLDDLQWLDTATLELMERLITDPDVRHVLIIGAYRDNEVSSSHPLMRMLAAIRSDGARVQEIVLAPLGPDDIGRLVSDSLRCERRAAGLLAQLVHEKTGGNPFFTIQFLLALAEEGLLRFDRDAACWIWDVDQIRGKRYSANVVDLMLGKLRRLSDSSQTALPQLACLGNVAQIATLIVVCGQSEEEIHTALLEAVRAGLVLRLERSYAFLHDRIHEAAYALIPESARARAHLRIGWALLASLTEDGLTEHLFDVANQLNRGAALVIDRGEKTQVATINLHAGRKARASAAHESARTYFAAGMTLLDVQNWGNQYELTFGLWLGRAECEFLSGNLDIAEQLIAELLARAASKVDLATVYQLKVRMHTMKGDYSQAVDNALTCLRLFGIDLPAHPSRKEVQAEYETVRRNLEGRPVESLIDLPLMTDPELQAAMDLSSDLSSVAYFTDLHLICLLACRVVNISMQHGVSGGSAHAYGCLGFFLGRLFHRYGEGYRFAKVGCDLVEKHNFIGHQAKVYIFAAIAAWWTQPVASVIDFSRKAFRIAIETGNRIYACYAPYYSVAALLQRNDPLDAVWCESEMTLDFVRGAKFRDFADAIVTQQRFIATMLGRTMTFSTFSDAQFDEGVFESQLTGDRMPMMVCSYWLVKLKARFLAGDYAAALSAGQQAQPILSAVVGLLAWFDYFYYTALTVSALYETASADQQQAWRELLRVHREQLCEWAEIYPPTFADKHTLVLAEIARLERRDADALCLYEGAIHLARENGFLQNEGLAHELIAQYYLARDIETAGYFYLRNARNCYDRWGAFGKVKQLDECYPRLREERTTTASATTGQPVAQLDIEAVVKASQALSSEMVLPKLIEKLVRIAVENAGAERGLLILLRGGEPRIEAEATTGHGRIEVAIRQAAVTPSDLPQSALHYVIRTLEAVLLDNASTDNVYAKDEYVRRKHSKSLLCLPIVNQSKLAGVLFLENNLTPYAFTPDRVAVLELLASQAAISLENAGLYSELRRSEACLVEGERICETGSFGWNISSGEVYWSEGTYNLFGYDRTAKPKVEMAFQRVHPDDRDRLGQALEHAIKEKTDFNVKHRLLMPDGTVKHCHVIGHVLQTSSGDLEFAGAGADITAVTLAEEKIRQSESELRQILDVAPQHVYVLGPDPDTARLYVNQAALDYLGLTAEEWRTCERRKFFHPDDWERATREAQSKFTAGLPHEVESRLLGKDGKYRWFLRRWNPLRDEHGRLARWYVAGTDIEDRKAAEQRLQAENVSLREELDKASMFEEIVGSSAALKKVLSHISKVAPTDSSVLITGETGTGKELVARAIHRRSRRSAHTFVSVNCATIPRDLIASELFGHEKGAFTGATQRRLGRFELADKGTLFLDEIGELPAETQTALLRVLQEHEFERVGGTGTIRADVRVIAATNRDLESAIAAGTFRSDLFYRLNVFPVEMPSLRERREDIPLLVRYFLNRYAREAGRRFTAVDKKSLDLLQAYAWPGNIRELQNVIERSVIVSETEILSVDGSWLSRQRSTAPDTRPGLFNRRPAQEKAIIEAALRECGARVSGPSGAAARLGIPGTTLESKIKALKINKNRFKEISQKTAGSTN
ncbi:MAG TPA: sigma 54-interacting transcriptional regulator [Bryobacteraceae bacterium]